MNFKSQKGISTPFVIATVVVVAFLALLGFLMTRNQATAPVQNETTQPTTETQPTPTTEDSSISPTEAAMEKGATKTVTVSGKSFSFSPAEIRVKKGDRVKITFNNTEAIHDFVIDEFEVQTDTIQGGKSDTVEFVADKAGTFEYYCSVGNHRAMGMKGKLIVE